jgi:hypothetical protein
LYSLGCRLLFYCAQHRDSSRCSKEYVHFFFSDASHRGPIAFASQIAFLSPPELSRCNELQGMCCGTSSSLSLRLLAMACLACWAPGLCVVEPFRIERFTLGYRAPRTHEWLCHSVHSDSMLRLGPRFVWRACSFCFATCIFIMARCVRGEYFPGTSPRIAEP